MNASLRMRQGMATLVTISLACMSLTTALVGASAAQAFAPHTAVTRYVGASVGTGASCASPGYTSVQAAVTAAAAGDTVYLCGTTPFAEEVIINKNLTLSGDAGATLKAPASYPAPATVLPKIPTKFTTDHLFVPETVLFVWGSTTSVTINAITVSGVMPTNGGCANDEYGLLVLDGATVALNGTKVKDIYDSNSALYGCQYGVGIQVGRTYWEKADYSGTVVENFVGHATLTGVTVSHSQKNNITVDGTGSTANISGSTVTGFGRDLAFAPTIASNGIQFSRGATGQIVNNTITGMDYTGTAPASSAGIIVFGGCGDGLVTNLKILNNTLTNNDVGVDAENYSANTSCNAAATSSTNVLICSNVITNDQVTNKGPETIGGKNYLGYQAGILEIGNHDTIIYNQITGSGYLPKRDTAGGPYTTDIDTTSVGASISPTIITTTTGQPTATPAPAAQQAFVRFVESTTVYASMDVALDKSPVITNVAQCTVSGYIAVASGTHSVTVFAPSGGAPISISFATFTAGAYYTVALVGNPPSVTPAAVVFTDDLSVDPSQAKVRVYHLSDSSGPLTVTRGSTTLSSSLAFEGATNYDTVAPGTVTYNLKENNAPNTNTADALALSANKVYSIFWMCGTKAVNVASAGIPKGLPNGGALTLPANFTWLIVGLVLVLLIGGGTALRIVTTRRSKAAA